MENEFNNSLVKTLEDHTKIMFHNFGITLKTCDMNYILCDMPIWKHVYHTLHSCDQWFINPKKYDEPFFHEKGLNSLDYLNGDRVLSRSELMDYFETIKIKIMDYLASLTDKDLYEKPDECDYNRLSYILGQMRHFYCHMGNINATTIVETNKWPRVVGMNGLAKGLDENDLYE